jgi:hypothetical protein
MTIQLNITEDYAITDGPSREELFDALRLFNEHRKVLFTLKRQDARESYTLPAIVMRIEPEDGSGHSWCLRIQFRDNHEIGVLLQECNEVFDVYYHDKRRHGAIVDGRPWRKRLSVDREGRIWLAGHQVAEVPKHVFS